MIIKVRKKELLFSMVLDEAKFIDPEEIQTFR
jgi:hypothetical protein